MSRLRTSRLIEAIGHRPKRMFRGYLAEAYDGIGKYVKVSLSRGSTSAAQVARVASGDFNGGRTFPVGTPVHLISFRGQLEVHLGNLPHANCDLFSRTVAQVPDHDPGSGQAGSWGKGPIGRWYSPDEYYRTHDGPWVSPITGEALGGTIYNIVYEIDPAGVPWNTNAWVEDGVAKLSYRVRDGDEFVLGSDPTQLIEIGRLPKKVVIDFQGPQGASSAFPEFQFYFGYAHHWVWDEWIVPYIFIGDDEVIAEVDDGFESESVADRPWTLDQGDSWLILDDVPPNSSYCREHFRVEVKFDGLGIHGRIWSLDSESRPPEPNFEKLWIQQPDPNYFNVMYIEDITSKFGAVTEEMETLSFNKVCIYY